MSNVNGNITLPSLASPACSFCHDVGIRPNVMDGPAGPVCACGSPSRHESGWCGEDHGPIFCVCRPYTPPAFSAESVPLGEFGELDDDEADALVTSFGEAERALLDESLHGPDLADKMAAHRAASLSGVQQDPLVRAQLEANKIRKEMSAEVRRAIADLVNLLMPQIKDRNGLIMLADHLEGARVRVMDEWPRRQLAEQEAARKAKNAPPGPAQTPTNGARK